MLLFCFFSSTVPFFPFFFGETYVFLSPSLLFLFLFFSPQVIETQKERAAQFDDESDLIDAYVACGGNADKSGCVSADMLIKIIKHDFGLTIDIEELIRAIDTDGSGEIEFEEFKTLLS